MGIFKRAEYVYADVLINQLGDDKISESMAKQIPAVAAAVDWIATRIKSLPIKLYTERDGKTEEIIDDYRLRLLNDENDFDTMTAAEMKEAMVRDYLLSGSGYAYIDWDMNRIRALHYVKASDVSYNAPVDPIYRSATYHIGGREYRPYQLLRLLRHTKDGVSGRSPREQSRSSTAITRGSRSTPARILQSTCCAKSTPLSTRSAS